MSRLIFHYLYFSNKNLIFPNQLKMKAQIIRDGFSTLLSLCDILHKKSGNQQIHMNRFGTNLLEYDFGIIRMRSKDHHRADRFIIKATKINALIKLREDLVIKNIKHRDLQFGKVIFTSPINIDFLSIDKMVKSLIQEASNEICDDYCLKAHHFFQNIIDENKIENQKCYLFNSGQALLAPNSNVMIEKRQMSGNIQSKKCRWTSDEVNLLVQLNKDLKGNIELICNYFPKRSQESINKKLKEVNKIKNKK